MITMLETPISILQLLLGWYLILIVAAIMIVVWQILVERRYGVAILSMLLLALCHFIYLPLRALEQYRDIGRTFDNWMEYAYSSPLLIVVTITFFISIWEAFVIKNSINWRMNHISGTSIYESFQKLPVGICCYQNGGMTRLVNRRMNQIAREITGKGIYNGQLFVENLRRISSGEGNILLENERESVTEILDEHSIVTKTNEGKVYSFTLTDIPFRNTMLHEILATDVTQEYINLMELNKEKKRVQDINSRLRAYSQSVVDVNIEKEILDAKVRIHDELGHALIVSKRYLRRGTGDKDAILDLWHKNIALLKEERSEQLADDYETIFYIAKCAGVEMEVEGVLPQEYPNIKKIIVTAMSECLTNVCHHAHGNLLNIAVREKDNQKIELVFTNNGDAPTGEIKEGGGLTNLRKVVEGIGGSMEIQSCPTYQLMLSVPVN